MLTVGLVFIVQTLSFMNCSCNFICGLSDVIIKTFSQSVSQSTSGSLSQQQGQRPHALATYRRHAFSNWLSRYTACTGTHTPCGIIRSFIHSFIHYKKAHNKRVRTITIDKAVGKTCVHELRTMKAHRETLKHRTH